MQFVEYYSGFARKVKCFFDFFNKILWKSLMDKAVKNCYDNKN